MLQKSYAVDAPQSIQDELIRKYTKKAKGISPPLLLTYPVPDLEGDYVEPEGGTWADNCYVNWDHQHPIGESNGKPNLLTTKINGKSVKLPIGYTKFFEKASDYKYTDLNIRNDAGKIVGKYQVDECLRVAEQAEKLVNSKIVTGVSIEFRDIEKVPIGPSAMRSQRKGLASKAWHIKKWDGFGWAHTCVPINPGAQMLMEKGFKNIDTSNYHPVIKKSFSDAVQYQNKSWSNGVTIDSEETMNKKASTYDPKDFDPEYEDKGSAVTETPPVEDAPDMPVDQPATPSDDNQPRGAVKAKLDFAQGLMDLCTRFAMDMKNSDNPDAKKVSNKLKQKAESLAKEAMGHAEKLHSKLNNDMAQDDGSDSYGEATDDEVKDETMTEEASESPEHEASETKEEEKAEHKEEDDDVDMDETGKIKPKSFPGYMPAYRMAPMKKSDFEEFASLVNKKSNKSKTDKLVNENAELKEMLGKLKVEHERALGQVSKFKELCDLGII